METWEKHLGKGGGAVNEKVVACILYHPRTAISHSPLFKTYAAFMLHVKRIHDQRHYLYLRDFVSPLQSRGVRFPGGRTLIVKLLDENPEEAFTVSQIRSRIDRSKGSVWTSLHRLERDGRIRRLDYGVYQSISSLVRAALPDPRLRVHGLKLECKGLGGWPYPTILQRLSQTWMSPELHRHPNNHSITGRNEWHTRPLTWTLHNGGSHLLEVFLEASTRPLTLLEAYAYFAAVEAATGLPEALWTIRQADWNIDIPGSIKASYAVDGLSIAKFGELMAKIYQKALDLIRTEVRDFRPLDVKSFMGYLESIFGAIAEMREAREA